MPAREHDITELVEFIPEPDGSLSVVARKFCDGSPWCPARIHVHGCFQDAGNCDRPHEHPFP